MKKHSSPCGCGSSGFDVTDPENQEQLKKVRGELEELLEVLEVLARVDSGSPAAQIRDQVYVVSKGLTCALKGGSKCFANIRREDITRMIQATEYLVKESSLTKPSVERIKKLSAEIAETIRQLNTEGRLRTEMMAKAIEQISMPAREKEVWSYPHQVQKSVFQRVREALIPCGCGKR
ncbi:MAG: hypothetical protein JRG73_11820 [Deltaproteobacteria bacterium]|nr:hypothetical protein [Deltaproteobacteria bacterium]MBW2307609.1 hypothetical protein [Deltaproteobacteria bacterium]